MNWIIWLVGMFFWWEETAYFGWNMLPQSPAEVICDGIAALIFALACLKRTNVHVTVNEKRITL